MPGLTKTRMVLQRVDLPGPPTFQQEEGRGHIVTVDADVFADMGSPDVITVTIEPGDRLN